MKTLRLGAIPLVSQKPERRCGTQVGLGVVAGAWVQALIADQLTSLVVPWGQVGVAAGLAVVIGLLAALGPAVRASRADILEAVADG